MGSYRVCLCFTRRFGLVDLEPPSEAREFFKMYTGGGAYMAPEQLRRFFVEAQGGPVRAITDAEKIVEEVLKQCHHIAKFTRNSLTFEDFFYYLFSVDLNPPFKTQINQDMTAPLSHYFIYTGHNSYLTGNQLTSDCSDKLIIKALKQGVRVIELDLWSNSNKDGINVLHGRTLTTPVDLQTCLQAIRDHAFESSEYPVIITLEDHLKPKLQAKAAQMITQTFGQLLYYHPSDYLEEFPSPETLKHKILISTKPPKEYLQAETDLVDVSSNSSERDLEHPSQCKIDVLENEHDPINGNDYTSQDKSQRFEPPAFTRKNILRGLALTLQTMIHLLVGCMELKWLRLTCRGMEKCFGKCTGCLEPTEPDFLLDANQVFDPEVKLDVKTKLMVKIYMGDGWRTDFKKTHFDKYSPPDFYTKVGIAGVPADETMQMTAIKEDQWIPVWNEEFMFPLTVPELALLRVEVHEHDNDKKDDFGGQTCLPVSELRTGIHAIPLYSRKGDKFNSVKLLMRFEFV